MVLVYLIPILVLLPGMKLLPENDYENNISRKRTNAINGIFVLFIFIRHMFGGGILAGKNSIGNLLFCYVDLFMGQLIVVPFLFFSGYGLGKSVLLKGENYLNGFIKKRFLKTLLHFDMAVVLYILLELYLHAELTWQQVLGAWTGWNQVGNSSWYMFAIFCLYLIFYFSFRLQRYFGVNHNFFIIFLILAYTIVVSLYKDNSWFNTVGVFASGVLFAENEKKIKSRIENHSVKWLIVIGILFGATYFCAFFVADFLYKPLYAVIYWVSGSAFAMLIYIVTSKVKIDNLMLQWLGNHAFEIYILQRIPMIIFEKYELPLIWKAVFVLMFTLLLSVGFKRIIVLVDRVLFNSHREKIG